MKIPFIANRLASSPVNSRLIMKRFVLLLVGGVLPAFALLFNIQSMAHADCVEPPPDMVGWWTGDDTSRDIIAGHHGTLHGTASYAPGEVLDGFRFDGSAGCYFSAPFVLTNSAFSVDLWVKATSATQA